MDRFHEKPTRSDDSASGYELAPTPRRVRLPGEVIVRRTAAESLDALTADLMAQAVTCVRTLGDFHLALGGDDSIDQLYMRLMSDPDLRAFPWKQTHLWLTHEWRANEAEDGVVFASVRDYLMDHSDIPLSQVHRPLIEDDDGPTEYERALRTELARRDRGHDRLDSVILTLDADGSAGGRAMIQRSRRDSEHWCEWVNGQTPRTMALTRRFMNASRMIGVIAFGEDRQNVVAMTEAAPASLTIAPLAGELRWYLDETAAGVD